MRGDFKGLGVQMMCRRPRHPAGKDTMVQGLQLGMAEDHCAGMAPSMQNAKQVYLVFN